ncbi:MAG: nucleoside triphosphate pyrophosphohydrolase [Gammaproteobacteria bacterium]|nr:nucleoside triphosphate pyrophosphohydrolase [Gammaproteobacteria bacterium]
MDELLTLMRALRDPKTGCAWDQAQTFETIAPYTIEEAYEVADAIEHRDWDELKSELGDLLFQVVFHSQIAMEAGHFDFADVAEGIVDKMRRRHPHIFGTAAERAAGAPDWEAMKQAERASGADVSPSALDGVATALPALTLADKIQRRAAKVGFDWPRLDGVVDKVNEELAELLDEVGRPTVAPQRVHSETGDLLFSCVNLSRHLSVNPETALRDATGRFSARFRHVERLAEERAVALDRASVATLEQLWTQAKSVTANE